MAKDFQTLVLGIRGISLKMRQLREKYRSNSDITKFNERQIFILERIEEYKEISPKEILGYFPGIAPSTITADLKLLQKYDLVERKWSPEDQRKHLVALTSKGKSLAKEIHSHQIATYKPLHRALKGSESQLEVLLDVVNKANEELDKELASFAKG